MREREGIPADLFQGGVDPLRAVFGDGLEEAPAALLEPAVRQELVPGGGGSLPGRRVASGLQLPDPSREAGKGFLRRSQSPLDAPGAWILSFKITAER